MARIDQLTHDALGEHEQWHAMVARQTGDLFYPDNPEDAAEFARAHGAVPVFGRSVRADVGAHVLCGAFPCRDCDRGDQCAP